MLRTALLLWLVLASIASADSTHRCLHDAGAAGVRCLDAYVHAVADCRARSDAACEQTARATGGSLDAIVAAPAAPSRDACSADSASRLGYLDVDDVGVRIPEACRDFGDDFLTTVYATSVPAAARTCQADVAGIADDVRRSVIHTTAACTLAGRRCSHPARDARIARVAKHASRRIVGACGAEFDALGLGAGADTSARVADLVATVVTRARHFAGRVYPAHDLGPTAEYGPYPVGVRTVTLYDASRIDPSGMGPRKVTVELYYPSTPEAVSGVPKDVVQVLGIDVVTTPAYRDVARAPGKLPVVLFSHGNGGIRFQSFFFASHLASHGYLVASPDHRGNTFVDLAAGIADANVATNRPLDMRFLLDQLLAFDAEPGNFLAGAVDADRVGMSGHSFGGFTAFTLAAGQYADPRIKAILPQAPAAPFSDDFFAAITVPVMILGGSIDETTPFASQQEIPFQKLHAGAKVVALGEIADAGHFTFSDFCEVPRGLLAFLGGFDEACEPRHVPWREAHTLINYLSLNFFDATLSNDVKALARLKPQRLNRLDDLTYSAK